jgi:hypothetical protein
MKQMAAAVVIVLVTGLGAFAQSAEQEVRKVHEALLAAAEAGDKAADANLAPTTSGG